MLMVVNCGSVEKSNVTRDRSAKRTQSRGNPKDPFIPRGTKAHQISSKNLQSSHHENHPEDKHQETAVACLGRRIGAAEPSYALREKRLSSI